MHRLLAVVLVAAAAAGCGSEGAAGRACGGGGDLLVTSRYDGDKGGYGGDAGGMEIYLLHPDGSAGDLVTGEDLVASDPSFNADGTQVVFVDALGDYESAGPESTSLSVIGLDGQGYRRVTGEEGPGGLGPNAPRVLDEDPEWSPTGDEIVFTRNDGSGDGYHPAIWIVPSDGSGPASLLVPGVDGYAPAFSADGQRVAFIAEDREDDPTDAVWVADADGSDAREVAALSSDGFRERDVTWSPDGERLYVGGDGTDGDSLVEVVVDSGEVTEIGPNGTDLVWVSAERLYARTRDLDARRPNRVDASGGGTTSSWTLPIEPSDPGPWRLTELRLEDGELASVERVGPSSYHVGIDGLDAVSCD